MPLPEGFRGLIVSGHVNYNGEFKYFPGAPREEVLTAFTFGLYPVVFDQSNFTQQAVLSGRFGGEPLPDATFQAVTVGLGGALDATTNYVRSNVTPTGSAANTFQRTLLEIGGALDITTAYVRADVLPTGSAANTFQRTGLAIGGEFIITTAYARVDTRPTDSFRAVAVAIGGALT